MEMHQIRYFLAVSRTLNFTRAAEESNVAQPSLTRAIKLLEEELGGELFRRERNLSHLTDLGIRMQPLLAQCYESAISAKSIATSIKSGRVAPLALALSRTVNIELLVGQLTELTRTFKGLELKFLRGSGEEVVEHLKKGDAELAIAGSFGAGWDRLDAWPLFEERFRLWLGADHKRSGSNGVEIGELKGERFLLRPYCEQATQLAERLRAGGVDIAGGHKVASEADLGALLAANAGIAIAPASLGSGDKVRGIEVRGLDLSRTVQVYAAAGRTRPPAAAALLKLLRAADWSRYAA